MLAATKHFCRDKHVCRDKTICRDKHVFVATKLNFVETVTKDAFRRDKYVFVATKVVTEKN